MQLQLPDANVTLFPDFLSKADSDRLFQSLLSKIQWRRETARMFGRMIEIPRLTAWYGEEGKTYTYSGISQQAIPWTADLLEIKDRIEPNATTTFNSVLLNRYRSGSDSVSWHADDEPELGNNPVTASVSFGQARRFQFKHKRDGLFEFAPAVAKRDAVDAVWGLLKPGMDGVSGG